MSKEASPETHDWVGRCGIRTPYESTHDVEYEEGETDDCLECDDSECQATVVPKDSK